MNHLTEEELIDILMDEPHPEVLKTHLAGCETCRESMETLRLGMDAAHMAEPKVPLMAVKPMTFDRMKGKPLVHRLGWFAAAAMLLLSFAGFRMDVGESGFSVQFAVLGTSDVGATDARIQELETQLAEVIDMTATQTQAQLDERFNLLLMERGMDMDQFTDQLDKRITNVEMLNAHYLSEIRDDLRKEVRNQNLKGTLQ